MRRSTGDNGASPPGSPAARATSRLSTPYRSRRESTSARARSSSPISGGSRRNQAVLGAPIAPTAPTALPRPAPDAAAFTGNAAVRARPVVRPRRRLLETRRGRTGVSARRAARTGAKVGAVARPRKTAVGRCAGRCPAPPSPATPVLSVPAVPVSAYPISPSARTGPTTGASGESEGEKAMRPTGAAPLPEAPRAAVPRSKAPRAAAPRPEAPPPAVVRAGAPPYDGPRSIASPPALSSAPAPFAEPTCSPALSGTTRHRTSPSARSSSSMPGRYPGTRAGRTYPSQAAAGRGTPSSTARASARAPSGSCSARFACAPTSPARSSTRR